MGFLTPASFWFLSFIGVLILFYFFKKQFDRRMIPSVYLWEQTVREWETNRRWRKLQRNLLLLLQMLVMLCLIFALARPYVSGEGVSGDQLVLVMDTSASMTVQEEDGTRFERAKAEALHLMDSLTDKQAVTFIEAKRTPDLIEGKTFDHDRVREAVEDLALSYQHADMNAALQLAESLVEDRGEIHIFTDQLREKQVNELDIGTKVTVHNIGTSRPNVSLSAFGVRADGDEVSAVVSVKNEAETAKAATVSIFHDGERLKQVEKEILADEELTFTVKGLPVKDVYKAVIPEEDAYPLDNQRWAFLGDDEPATLYLAGEVNSFLHKALQYSGAEIVQVTENERGEYKFPEDAGNEAVYVLSGIPAKEWPRGAKWIVSPETGGPFRIGEKSPLRYKLVQKADDPLLQYVDVQQMYLEKAYPIGELNGLTPLISGGDVPIVAKGTFNGAKTVLFAFDIRDSDWPLHPGFPILVQHVLAYLSEQHESLGYYLPGERRPLTFAPTAQSAKIETGDGEDVTDVALDEDMLRAPAQPGYYRLREQTANGLRTRVFAVVPDERERTARAAESFTRTPDHEEASGRPDPVKREWWRWLAALGLFLLFAEWEVYRRGIASR